MRVAMFSPLPPARSGIADYSAALAEALGQYVELTAVAAPSASVADADIRLYQLGNNPHHTFVYEQALETPGVIVLHEANLHHLIADLTIKRGDWDAYMREVEYNAGPSAMAYAERVRRLEVGPDYEGIPMLRRVLERSRGVIVHSRFVESEVRRAGFAGPVAVIPHGAWLPSAKRYHYRELLGLTPTDTLLGIFGFLKPYKRIPESLRAFRRVVRTHPEVKLILVGEVHPDLPLESLIRSLDLRAHVRLVGFTEPGDFTGYISAADVVLNLRYPTVGETSGTLLRALGLGKAVIVSDVGAFAEYPDGVCLKAPVDATEEDSLFEYINLLIERPDLRDELGSSAREWVAHECTWEHVARKYAAFLAHVCGCESVRETASAPPDEPSVPAETVQVAADAFRAWLPPGWAQEYFESHAYRLPHTLEITPPGAPDRRILEMGSYLHVAPLLKSHLKYGEVRASYFGPSGNTEVRTARSSTGEEFTCPIELFDAERDRFPYDDSYFDTVLCCELIEHLPEDPMFMMGEINRILKTGGSLVLTTPNAASLRALTAILYGYHPGFFPAYILPKKPGEEPDPRHAREYTPLEIRLLLENSGFEVALLETGPFRGEPHPEQHWIATLLRQLKVPTEHRADGIYAVARKLGPVRERYPEWLYV